MSTSIEFHRGTEWDAEYTIKIVQGCKLIFGNVPISEYKGLTRGFSKKALMDFDMADRLGAVLVFGEPENLEGLRKLDLPVSEKRQRDYQAAIDQGLKDVAAWLRTGSRGRSSDAMCKRIFGLPSRADDSHPVDPSDLRRCLMFLDATRAHDKVSLMADVSGPWSRLVDNWCELAATLSEEVASGKTAPRTHKLMSRYVDESAELP